MDMLTFSKEREPDLTAANLNEVVADVIELMRVRAGEVQVELHWRPGEPMPELVFDPEGIHRAVLNVVTNAIDAVSERETPGRVEVATAVPGRTEGWCESSSTTTGRAFPPTRWSTSSARSSRRRGAAARAWACR